MAGKIAIIGAGKLGATIARRLAENGEYSGRVIAADRNERKLAALRAEGIETATDNALAVRAADTAILCVKPKDIGGLGAQIGASCAGKLVISVAAGVSISRLEKLLPGARVIRCMPNLSAAIGMSQTGVSASKSTTDADRKAAESIFGLLGSYTHIGEERMAAWTGLSGSCPAYVSACIDATARVAQSEGFSRAESVKLAASVAMATARLLLETGEDPLELVQRVASPNGTTEAGLKVADELGLVENFSESLRAAISRARELER